jgi:hypothetical protein
MAIEQADPFRPAGSFRFTMNRSDAMAPKTHACCRDRSSGQCSIRPIFVGKPIRKLDRFLSRDRYRENRRYENITDVLVFLFGSTPIFCRDYQSAMWLAEYCQLNGPPPGLSWVVACPDDKDGAIEFARKCRIDEAHCATHS